MKKLISFLILFGLALYGQAQTCTNCENTETSGSNASAIGKETKANGLGAFASGFGSEADGFYTTSLGFYAKSTAPKSMAFGSAVLATGGSSIVIGSGEYNSGNYLTNYVPRSLMIGFGSKNPTLFISEASASAYFDKTGRVGIGNITNPQTKLHLLSDVDEEAAIFIQPYDFLNGDHARLIIGDTNNYINASAELGIEVLSSKNLIFNGNYTGFGVNKPKAKVHIDGDILFEQSMNGIIMKSEDGNCWKGTISNEGILTFNQFDCETLTSIETNTEDVKHSQIFIYPNPTNSRIIIEYTGNKRDLRAEFRDLNGVLLSTHKIERGDNNISLGHLSSRIIITNIFSKRGDLISSNKVVVK